MRYFLILFMYLYVSKIIALFVFFFSSIADLRQVADIAILSVQVFTSDNLD